MILTSRVNENVTSPCPVAVASPWEVASMDVEDVVGLKVRANRAKGFVPAKLLAYWYTLKAEIPPGSNREAITVAMAGPCLLSEKPYA